MTPERWRQVEEIFHAAMSRGESERVAYLAHTCAGDLALRREVEALLARQESGFLEAPAVPAAAPTVSDAGTSLLTGRRLGAYQVHERIGVGGMGEVYRARDTKLGRDVAIKILPRLFISDPDRLARFEREARVLASLNHPHIGAIYGLEDADGVRALVLELVNGETLADRIVHGPIPVNDTLTIARQIADALDAAHEKGIIHRDLKPANIKITPDGVVKVLDFGLAKAAVGDGATPDLSQSPTMTVSGTREGVILGTAAYMSPEQARGKTVDKRTDIWAFACVLYEMLTGRAVFPGETISDTIAAILEREPDWTPLPAQTPASIRRLLERCLDKDPKRRVRDVGDARMELDDGLTSERASMLRPSDNTPRAERRWRTLALAATTILVVALGTFALTRSLWPTATIPSSIRFDRLTDFVGLEESPALSPDRKSVAFTGDVQGRRQLWVRLIAGGPPLRLTREPVDHLFPRWSPDSSTIVYFSPATEDSASGAVWEISALGGAPRRIAGSLTGADVSHDGKRLAFFRLASGRTELVIANRDGSSIEAVATLEAGFIYQTPRWAPDDKRLAYERKYLAQGGSIFVVDLKTRTPESVVAHSTQLAGLTWLPDGTGFMYSSARGSTIPYLPKFQLWAFVFGTTEARQLTFGDASYLHPDAGADGTVVASRLHLASDIWRFPTNGTGQQNVARGVRISRQTGEVRTPSVSPDDRQLVFLSDSGGHANLWVTTLDAGETRQLTFERDPSVAVGVPVWSPRDDRIAFYSQPLQPQFVGGYWQVIHADGSSPRRVIERGWWTSWSPDGLWLYYQDLESVPSELLKKIPIEGGPPTTVRTDNAIMPALSPDGGTLYFAVAVPRATGTVDYEIRSARPENAASTLLARISGNRVPDGLFHPTLSADGEWLALPLTDGVTSNVWGISTKTGAIRMLTDFGQRPTFITRRVSWSFTSPVIYAAVGEGDADVVLIGGLNP